MNPTTIRTRPSAVETINNQLDTRLLTRGRIVMIGQGGIGTILSRFLVLFIATLPGKYRVLFCDGDAYKTGNKYRMDIPDYDNKAVALARELNDRLGRPGLSLRPYPHYLNQTNRSEVIREGDLVLLSVDNHATRKSVSDHCQTLRDVALVSGGNDGVGDGQRGTYGNVQLYVRQDGNELAGAPLDRFHPEIANPDDQNPDDSHDCMQLDQAGVAQYLPVNLMVASAMLGVVHRLLMPPEGEGMFTEICLDVLDATMLPSWLTGERQANQGS